MAPEQHLTVLQYELSQHRATLQKLWEEQATHEHAIAAIKATLQASGVPCDTSPYDDSGKPIPVSNLPDEAQRAIERALRGPMTRQRFTQ